MSEIVTRIKPGDTVWWVHCSNKVYKGTVQSVTLCEYQGALYCNLHSPSFRKNQFPVVHYSNVFPSRQEAEKYAEYQKQNPDSIFPVCMGCHFNAMKNAIIEAEDEIE